MVVLAGVLALFSLPFFFIRLFQRKEGKTILLGWAQDLFVVLLPLSVVALTHTLFSWHSNLLLVALGGVYFLFYSFVLVDACLYHKLQLRFDFSFISAFREVNSFFDSVKTTEMVLFLGGCLFSAVFPFSLITLLKDDLSVLQDIGFLLLMLALAGFGTLASYFVYAKSDLYSFENLILRQVRRGLERWWNVLFRGNNKEDLSFLKSKNERCHYLDTAAPLLKCTTGFFGEKQCSIDVKKGERPHVIFLFLESFRSQEISSLTPHFKALSNEGIYFKNFYANAIPTYRTVISSLFGIPAIMDEWWSPSKLDFPLISLADILSQNGYCSSYVHGGSLQLENKRNFFARYGFETVLGKNDILKKCPHASKTSWGIHDEHVMKYGVDYLLEHRDTPQFLTLSTLSNHEPWIAPKDFTSPKISEDLPQAKQRFLKTVHYTDHCLGLFVDLLKKHNLSKDVVLFVMGDHGFPMGEHGDNFILQRNLYEENIHVPLLICAEGRIEDPITMECVASQVDLIPTVMDLLHVTGVNHSVGTTLLRECAEREAFFYNPYVYHYLGLRRGDYKAIVTQLTSELELYDLVSDPEEAVDLSNAMSEQAQGLQARILQYEKVLTSLSQKRAFAKNRDKEKASTPALTSLNLSRQLALSRDQLSALAQSNPELQELNLSHCATIVDESFLPFLEHCPKLHSLNLSHCVALSESLVERIFISCSALEELRLEYLCLNEGLFDRIDQSLSSLLLLHLRGGAQINDHDVEKLAKLCPNVEEMSLTCSNLSRKGLEKLFSSFSFKLVTLEGGEHLLEDDLIHSFKGAESVESLSLTDFSVSDRFLYVVKARPMHFFSIDCANGITDEGLESLHHWEIKHLNLGYPKNVSQDALLALRESLPSLRSLFCNGLPLCLNSLSQRAF